MKKPTGRPPSGTVIRMTPKRRDDRHEKPQGAILIDRVFDRKLGRFVDDDEPQIEGNFELDGEEEAGPPGGDRPEAMTQAGDLVRRAKVFLRPEMPASLHQECDLLSAVQQALSGQTAIARLVLQGLHAADQRNTRVGAALAAVGR